MRFYLAQQMEAATDPHRGLLALLLGSGWAGLQHHFALFPSSSPVFWITVFWLLDWLLGSWLAIRRRQWSPRRSGYSVAKWLLWMTALAVAWGVRDMAFPGSSYVATIMEAAIILAEGSSVLRNAGLLSDNRMAKRLLSGFAEALEGRVAELESKLESIEGAQIEKVGT